MYGRSSTMQATSSRQTFATPIGVGKPFFEIPGFFRTTSFRRCKNFVEFYLTDLYDLNAGDDDSGIHLREASEDVFQMLNDLLCSYHKAYKFGFLNVDDESCIHDIIVTPNENYDEENKFSPKFNILVELYPDANGVRKLVKTSYTKVIARSRQQVSVPLYVNEELLQQHAATEEQQEEPVEQEPVVEEPVEQAPIEQEVRRSKRQRRAPERYE